ncbi:MAG: POTRA domain-containing protein, partial [Acidobacteriaceae bacterium]
MAMLFIPCPSLCAQATPAPTQTQPQLQTPPEAPAPPAPSSATAVVQEIIVHGNRRIPADTIRARISTKPGDIYDQAILERDFNALWNTGYFDDLRIEREATPKGWRIHIYVAEKPTISEINYKGLSSVTQSDVLDRFKKDKIPISVESQYDPTKVTKAKVD